MDYTKYRLEGYAISACIEACILYTNGLAQGTITPPKQKHRSYQRWAPSFLTGRRPRKGQLQINYTSKDVSAWMGNSTTEDKAHSVVRVALGLLEYLERGHITFIDLHIISEGGPGLTTAELRTKLKWCDAHRGHCRTETLHDHLLQAA